MKTLVLTERGEVIRKLYQERIGTAPAAMQNLSDEDAAILVEILSRAKPELASSVAGGV